MARRDFGRIAIGMRAGADGIPVPTVASLMAMIMQGIRFDDVLMPFPHRQYHHSAANSLAAAFLDTPCDSLLYIDADQVFVPDTLERLRSNKHGQEFDILGGLYIDRIKGVPHAYKFESMYDDDPDRPGYTRLTDWTPGHVVEVDALGLGFTLFRREVIEAIGPPWFYFRGKYSEAGEDITACYNARQAGFTVGLDTSVSVGHLAVHSIEWKHFEAQRKARERGAA